MAHLRMAVTLILQMVSPCRLRAATASARAALYLGRKYLLLLHHRTSTYSVGEVREIVARGTPIKTSRNPTRLVFEMRQSIPIPKGHN
jgi:hypothetical protein